LVDGEKVFVFELGEVFDYLAFGHSVGEHGEELLSGNAIAADTAFSAEFIGFGGDAVQLFIPAYCR
jgi:hypothetical protein